MKTTLLATCLLLFATVPLQQVSAIQAGQSSESGKASSTIQRSLNMADNQEVDTTDLEKRIQKYEEMVVSIKEKLKEAKERDLTRYVIKLRRSLKQTNRTLKRYKKELKEMQDPQE